MKSPSSKAQRRDQLILACRSATKAYGFMFTPDRNDVQTECVYVNRRHMERIEKAVAAMVEAKEIK